MQRSAERRLRSLHAAVAPKLRPEASGAATTKKQRVALVGMTQEVAHQNPVPSTAEDFDMSRGDDLLHFSKGTYIGGAVSVLSARDDIELVPIYAAGGPSAGVLEHSSFLTMADELLSGVRAAGKLDAVYFSLHGAMATFEEHDPEGWCTCCCSLFPALSGSSLLIRSCAQCSRSCGRSSATCRSRSPWTCTAS